MHTIPAYFKEVGQEVAHRLVLLEAQACGVPVITSARGGATEGIRHGETGFAFPEGDIPALEAALILLLNDDALVGSMSTKARLHVETHFDITRCTAALEELYDQVCQTSGP